MSPEQQEKLELIDRGEASLSSEELQSKSIPEIPAVYVDWIEEGWMENVAK